MSTNYDPSWKSVLQPLFSEEYMLRLSAYIQEQRSVAKVFPSEEDVFNAFRWTAFDAVKVVILGQDPYHNDGQAHGLSFSVPEGVLFPPSLKNIFKEQMHDLPGLTYPRSGDLTPWAQQGVFLLNATLTVRAHEAGSHQHQGWERFTDAIIREISQQRTGVVFLLWGGFAQKKAALIDGSKHLILTSAHPSPLSAYRGFFGCRHFSQANAYLVSQGLSAIDWQL